MGSASELGFGSQKAAYDLQLTRYDECGWRAMFYTTGMEHSPTSATGTGWELGWGRSHPLSEYFKFPA